VSLFIDGRKRVARKGNKMACNLNMICRGCPDLWRKLLTTFEEVEL